MIKQNITLSLPKDVLRKAKSFAVERKTSVSSLVAELLTDLVKQKEQYTSAKREHLAILSESPDLGTNGSIRWSRDSLYER